VRVRDQVGRLDIGVTSTGLLAFPPDPVNGPIIAPWSRHYTGIQLS
jgi:hypothetical protein